MYGLRNPSSTFISAHRHGCLGHKTRLGRRLSTWICAQSYPEVLESTMHISARLGLSMLFLGLWSIWAKARAHQPNLQAEHQRAAREITTN